MPDVTAHVLASRADPPAQRLQHAIATFEAADRRARHHFDIGETPDAINQITRHRRTEIVAAHQHPYLGGVTGQINYGLTGGVARANQSHFLTGA